MEVLNYKFVILSFVFNIIIYDKLSNLYLFSKNLDTKSGLEEINNVHYNNIRKSLLLYFRLSYLFLRPSFLILSKRVYQLNCLPSIKLSFLSTFSSFSIIVFIYLFVFVTPLTLLRYFI